MCVCVQLHQREAGAEAASDEWPTELTNRQHRLSQYQMQWDIEIEKPLQRKGRQIKMENKWPHSPLYPTRSTILHNLNSMANDFLRRSHEIISMPWITYLSLTIALPAIGPHQLLRNSRVLVCVASVFGCNVISHKTLNWFLFTIFCSPLHFVLSLSFDPLFCLIEFFHVFFLRLSFTLKALPCTVASTFRRRYELQCNVEMESERDRAIRIPYTYVLK